MYHEPVLLQESIQGLNIKGDGTYIDVTFGGGGHSREILRKLTTGKLFGFDRDQDALANTIDDDRFTLINQNFRYLGNYLKFYGITSCDGLLADLGISSHQIDMPERGFSTRFTASLDLRMDRRKELDGREVINTYSEEAITRILKEYGEVTRARAMAKSIVEARSAARLNTTTDLRQAIIKYLPRGKENKELARVFQAIRIEVNEELQALREMLVQAVDLLVPGGRLAVISYHSLEDRLVKNIIKTGNLEGRMEKDFYGTPLVSLKMVTRKPITAGEKEIEKNPRARSAKLRIAEKI